jgi:hypothetical protein
MKAPDMKSKDISNGTQRSSVFSNVIWTRHVCPRCDSVQFKPAELRSFDGLLSVLALRPVRCMFCWRRYYWFALRPLDMT